MTSIPERIVFFDGVCNLCNSSVNFLMRHDKHHRLTFSPLQGKLAETLKLVGEDIGNSFIYFRKGKVHRESTAVIFVLSDLGFWWKWIWIFYVIPHFLRNPMYRFVAKNRYKWFGKRDTCRIIGSD